MILINPEIDLPLHRQGKVRNVYDLNKDHFLLVSSDRVSAFDFILNQGIPNKGEALNNISKYWFEYIGQNPFPTHYVPTTIEDFPVDKCLYKRSMIVKKAKPLPVECIVRGYIAGSGWKSYQKTGSICGHKLPEGLQLAQQLPEPIFTPTTKSDIHDEDINFNQLVGIVGSDIAEYLKKTCLTLYRSAAKKAIAKGIIIADTKFEFGMIDDEVCIIDEALTPDSSRFWNVNEYIIGVSPKSWDKQIIRDYLESVWDKTSPIPDLPPEIVLKTQNAYQEIWNKLTT